MTPLIHFHRADTANALADQLASFVADALRQGLQQRDEALLVVSGGSTPVPFFEALSQLPLDWSRVTVTLADERWLPEEHQDSNARLVKTHLLKGAATQARFLPLYSAADTPVQGQADTERALGTLSWPADVVVLGMGGDGHTASLFPYAAELAQAVHEGGAPRCLPVAAPALPNVPVPRLTMTGRALLDTRCLVVHLTGADKLALLKRAMQDGPVDEWPIRLALHQAKVPCEVFHAD